MLFFGRRSRLRDAKSQANRDTPDPAVMPNTLPLAIGSGTGLRSDLSAGTVKNFTATSITGSRKTYL